MVIIFKKIIRLEVTKLTQLHGLTATVMISSMQLVSIKKWGRGIYKQVNKNMTVSNPAT